jgi:hypothetical protein
VACSRHNFDELASFCWSLSGPHTHKPRHPYVPGLWRCKGMGDAAPGLCCGSRRHPVDSPPAAGGRCGMGSDPRKVMVLPT